MQPYSFFQQYKNCFSQVYDVYMRVNRGLCIVNKSEQSVPTLRKMYLSLTLRLMCIIHIRHWILVIGKKATLK